MGEASLRPIRPNESHALNIDQKGFGGFFSRTPFSISIYRLHSHLEDGETFDPNLTNDAPFSIRGTGFELAFVDGKLTRYLIRTSTWWALERP